MFPKIGVTPKWMVKIMENPSKMGWFRGQTHYFRKHPFGELTSFPILRSKKSKVQASAVLLCHVADVYLPPVFLLMAKKDGNSRLIYILRFQPPLKHWVFSYNHHWLPKGFNHRNWGKSIILMVVEAQGIASPKWRNNHVPLHSGVCDNQLKQP